MNGQMIITIGREFGSGGHEIAERIAAHYDIPLYDKQLIQEVAEDGMLSPSVVAQFDEKPLSVFARPMPGDGGNLSMEQQIALRTFTYLNKQANVNKISFVVVGRCAESFLVGNPALTRIFVLGDEDVKRKRIMEKYQLDGRQATLRMRREDKLRKSYHNFYCENKWGDSRTYDLCINSSLLGVEKTAEALIQFLNLRYA